MKESVMCRLYRQEDNGDTWAFFERTKEDVLEERQRASQFYVTLSKEQKQLYLEVQSDEGKQLAYQMELQYRRGFRAGAKMMMEILTEEE